jgi:LacI family transcriptional regulator
MPHGRRVGIALDIQLLFKHHTEVFAGVQHYADEAGWTTVIDNWPEETLDRGKRGKPAYDGIIARVTPERMPLVEMAAATGVPVVNVMCGSPAFARLPGVFPDYAGVGRMQAEHLLGRGVRNFAFVGIQRRRPDELQRGGFKAAVEAGGHEVSEFDLPDSWDDDRELFRQTRTRILAWMNTWKTPVGLASSTDDVVRYVAQLCHDRGWRVPQDVALIGNRNEEHLCEKPRPALSSVEIGFDRIGCEAARLLDLLMSRAKPRGGRGRKSAGASDQSAPEHVILPPVGIVARDSTDSFATDDPLVAEAQAFIAEHCHTPIDVNHVALAIMVSTKTLQNHFARSLGTGVGQEIRRARVERAKRELAGSDISIDEVAKRAGFTSNARLCEVFRRDVGMSPREYRRVRKPQRTR